MNKTIRFCYRKIIDATTNGTWEKLVLEDSYNEFRMQAQRFNEGGRHHSFTAILQHNPDAAQLHFLVSGAIAPYMKHFDGKIPDIQNTLGKHFLPFKEFRFEIVNSDITERTRHCIAINFYSQPAMWLDTVGEKMIISLQTEAINGEWLTETISLQPFLSIYSVKQ